MEYKGRGCMCWHDMYTFHENACVGSKFVEFKVTDIK